MVNVTIRLWTLGAVVSHLFINQPVYGDMALTPQAYFLASQLGPGTPSPHPAESGAAYLQRLKVSIQKKLAARLANKAMTVQKNRVPEAVVIAHGKQMFLLEFQNLLSGLYHGSQWEPLHLSPQEKMALALDLQKWFLKHVENVDKWGVDKSLEEAFGPQWFEKGMEEGEPLDVILVAQDGDKDFEPQ